jgi:putative ABC transport system substrate-binding protein
MSTGTRRQFLAGLTAMFAGMAVGQRLPDKVHRIGILRDFGTREGSDIPEQLRKLGYEEGQHCVYEFRSANGQRDRLPGLAAELVAASVDVIIAYLPPEILAAKQATSIIPIVMVYGMVPEELGLVHSLGRPGGNVTGTLIQGPEWAGKQFQIARDLFGRNARIANLYDASYPGLQFYVDQIQQAGKRLDLQVERWPIRTDDDVQSAIVRLGKERPAAFSFAPTGPIGRQLEPLMAFASKQRLPGISSTKWPVEHFGALYAYEPDLEKIKRRAMAIVDKILKGATPGKTPVEQPTHYELWINVKSAQHCGVRIPSGVLAQATRLIE